MVLSSTIKELIKNKNEFIFSYSLEVSSELSSKKFIDKCLTEASKSALFVISELIFSRRRQQFNIRISVYIKQPINKEQKIIPEKAVMVIINE